MYPNQLYPKVDGETACPLPLIKLDDNMFYVAFDRTGLIIQVGYFRLKKAKRTCSISDGRKVLSQRQSALNNKDILT